ncbi:MAG: TolC family protein [bacterium]
MLFAAVVCVSQSALAWAGRSSRTAPVTDIDLGPPPEGKGEFLPPSNGTEVKGPQVAAPAAQPDAAGGDEFGLVLEKGAEAARPEVGALTLDDCIRLALARNARLKAAGQDVEAARGQLTEAKAAFWPVLEYQYRIAPVPNDVNDALNKFFDGEVTFFNSIRVGIGVPLMAFGQLHTAKKLAQGGLEAARTNEEKAHNNTIFQVKQLYYGIQMAKEMIKLLDEANGKMKDKIAGEEAKEQPTMNPYDLLQLKGYRYEIERRLEETKQNLLIAEEGFRIQLDLEPGAEIVFDTDNLKPVLASLDKEQEYVDTATAVQPEARLLDIGVATKKRLYQLEKYKLFPRFGFGFFVEVGRTAGAIAGVQNLDDYNNPFNYSRAGLGFQLSGTLDFHGAAGRIKRATAEYHKAVYDGMIARRALALDIRKAYLEAKRAKYNLTLAKKAQSVANQMMFITKINMDIGIGETEKYGDALKYVLLSRGLFFKSIFDYNMALADLEQRVGEARYAQLVPRPDVEDYEAFDEEEEAGFITIDEEGNSNVQKGNNEKVQ